MLWPLEIRKRTCIIRTLARQAFISYDPEGRGSIPAMDFIKLMIKIRQFRMSSYVHDHLISVSWCVLYYHYTLYVDVHHYYFAGVAMVI